MHYLYLEQLSLCYDYCQLGVYTYHCTLIRGPESILYKSIAGRYRPVSYPDGPITARYRFIKNASWEGTVARQKNENKKMHHAKYMHFAEIQLIFDCSKVFSCTNVQSCHIRKFSCIPFRSRYGRCFARLAILCI